MGEPRRGIHRPMLGFRLGIIALATAMLPGLCRADITETFLDGGSNLEYTIGGSTPASCGTFLPGGCDVAIFGSGIFPASLDLLINIFEPTGGAISDTMQISTDSAGSELETIFLSNDDGTATLFPYTNGTSITENGKIQTAATVALIGSATRSEERRVGKECRSRWSPYH